MSDGGKQKYVPEADEVSSMSDKNETDPFNVVESEEVQELYSPRNCWYLHAVRILVHESA